MILESHYLSNFDSLCNLHLWFKKRLLVLELLPKANDKEKDIEEIRLGIIIVDHLVYCLIKLHGKDM